VGFLVIGELTELVVRGSQICNRAARRSRRWGLVGSLGCACRVYAASLSLDVQAAPDLVTRVSSETERVSPLQPGSFLLIRDTLSTADSSGTRVDISIVDWHAMWFRQGPSITRLRIWCCNQEAHSAHPGRDRRAHHRRAAGGVLWGHGHRGPGRRAGAIPELWPLGTEALALAMEVSVLEAKRLGHRAVLRLPWLLLVASVALSTLLQSPLPRPSWLAI
jgi:hypothetical protein